MKILIPVLNFGKAGGYRVLSKLADELIDLGHTVDFMSPETSIQPYYPTKASVKWINSNGEIVNYSEKETVKVDSGLSILRKLAKGLKKLKKDSYDVIIANHSLTIFPIWKAGLLNKTLYYVQAYETELYNLYGGLKNRMLGILCTITYKKKLFTVVNAGAYLNYKKLKSSRILYPGIDFNLFYPGIKKPPNEDHKIIIGTIGRMETFKGTRFIIQAFRELKQKYPAIELHVAFGDPVEFVNEKGIYCFQPDGDAELGNFYRSLDYYICAGYIQLGGFHYPVTEAMSCGVPVITTEYYPAKENNAWITNPQKIEDIILQFEMAKNNPMLTEKKLQQALIDVKQFDWKLVGEKLNNYLNEFLATFEENKK